MNFVVIGKTLLRYWRMTQDPRTPSLVRGLIYVGIAASVAPKKLLPKNIPGLGLMDEAALLPSIIALAMVLIPKRVREEYDRKERGEAIQGRREGLAQAQGSSAAASGVLAKG